MLCLRRDGLGIVVQNGTGKNNGHDWRSSVGWVVFKYVKFGYEIVRTTSGNILSRPVFSSIDIRAWLRAPEVHCEHRLSHARNF